MSPSATVPINDSSRRLRKHRGNIEAAVSRVLDSGHLILGPENERFEAAYAAHVGVAHCVTVANGTDALEIAIRSLELPAGSVIATVANAGMYATTAILAAGMRPLFIDVDAATANMSAPGLAEALNLQPAAVIVTHLYGRMADMPSLAALTEDAGIPMIEDCAQAHGARLGGRSAGAWGYIGCFSFYPTKNLGGIGDGGAIVCTDSNVAGRARQLRQYGWESKYRSVRRGGRNSRLDEVNAAVLHDLLPMLAPDNRRRKHIAATYDQALDGCPQQRFAPRDHDDAVHLYVALPNDRRGMDDALQAHGIASAVHYPIADHQQPCLESNSLALLPLENTERLCGRVLSLPCFPELTDSEVERVAETLRSYCEEASASNS